MNSNLFILEWPKKWFIATAMKDYGYKIIPPPPKGIGLAESIHIQTEREIQALGDRRHAYLIVSATVMDLYALLAGEQYGERWNKRYEQLAYLRFGGGQYMGVFQTNLSCPWVQISEIRKIIERLMQA